MKLNKSQIITSGLLVIAIIIHIYSNDSTRVENLYSRGIYPYISSFLRYLFGWLPFSIGDVLYGGIMIWFTWKLIRGLKALFRKQVNWQHIFSLAGKAFRIILILYIFFNVFWGINYNRMGIADQLGLDTEKYSLEDLKIINGLLAVKTNMAKGSLINRKIKDPSKTELFAKVNTAYQEAEKVYPFLKYQPVSLKPSMWSWVGNYMGFTGYYNPFTGEAQVNTLVPQFLQPFTTCHEVAHQLGYAKEMEANFVGYLAATTSSDTVLHYSVYLDMFMYSNRILFETDSVAAKAFRQQLIPDVKKDLLEWKSFYKRYRNPIEPVFRWIYGVYLERNQQPQGVLSYDQVTGILIAYHKKFGKI